MNNRQGIADLEEKIARKIGEDGLLVQTAKECAELSKAVLELLNEPEAEILNNIIEKMIDVSICIDILDEIIGCGKYFDKIKEEKCNRWIERIEEKERK